MVLDRSLAHDERAGDLEVGLAASKQAQHLDLARGESIDAGRPGAHRPRHHPIAGLGRQLGEAGAHPADRGTQLVMVQLEHLAEHRPFEHAGQPLGVAGGDLGVEHVERRARRAGGAGVGVEQPQRVSLHDERGHHVDVPTEHVGQPPRGARTRSAGLHDLGLLAARHLVLDRGIFEPHRRAPQFLERGRGSARILSAPDDARVQTVRADVADQHPVEFRARAELLGGPLEDALRRADLPEPPDRVGHALERIGAPHVFGFDDLALQTEQLDQRTPERGRVSHACFRCVRRGLAWRAAGAP